MNFPTRLNSLDVARGLAALAVVLWHWQHFFFNKDVLREDFDSSAQPLYDLLGPLYERGGYAGVSFFFTLSGFVFFWLYREQIADRRCSVIRFTVLRFARLYPLHILTLATVLVLQAIYFSLHSNYFVFLYNDGYHLFLQLIFGSHWGFERGYSFNGPVWSVSIEIGLYAAFYVIAFLRVSGWRSLLAMVALLLLYQEIGGGGRWSIALEAFFVGGLTFHALNGYFAHSWRSPLSDGIIIVGAITRWCLMGASETISNIIFERHRLYSRVLFPLTISALVLLECSGRVDFRRFRWIGDITYSSYLLHFPLQIIFALTAARMGYDSAIFYSPWLLISFFAVLIPLSLITFHDFERPVQSIIRNRALGKRAVEQQ